MNTKEIMYLTNPLRKLVSKLGDKWTLLILYQLSHTQGMRFVEFKSEMIDISEKELSKKLKVLVDDGLVEKQVVYSFPMSISYSITQRGQDLMIIIEQLIDWAIKNFHKDDIWVDARGHS